MKINQAMILASGRGNRMMPLTKDLPKAMIRIGNVTLLEDKIIKLAESGISRLVINTGYLGDYIKDHVGDGSKFGIEIIISDEGKMPIGTASGIRKAVNHFNDKPFIVVNADIWTNYLFINLMNYELETNQMAHLVLTPKPDYQKGDFNLGDGGHIAPGSTYTFTGIGLYRPELFIKSDEKELGSILKQNQSIKAEIYNGLWHDIGTPERLNMIRKTIGL